MIWDVWKQGFAAWEQATTQYMEKVLQNPGVLGPAGAMLTAAMKTKVATDRALAAWWSAFGLPTRRDQERALHKLNQLESRLYDLEEHLLERGGSESGPGGTRGSGNRPTGGHSDPTSGRQGPTSGLRRDEPRAANADELRPANELRSTTLPGPMTGASPTIDAERSEIGER